jgi:hypothetical protein
LYFLSNFFTHLMGVSFIAMSGGIRSAARRGGADGPMADLVQNLWYGSVDGMNIGLFKGIFQTAGSMPFGLPGRGLFIKAPPLWLPIVVVGLLSFLMMFIAWRRIRAVEVVG